MKHDHRCPWCDGDVSKLIDDIEDINTNISQVLVECPLCHKRIALVHYTWKVEWEIDKVDF